MADVQTCRRCGVRLPLPSGPTAREIVCACGERNPIGFDVDSTVVNFRQTAVMPPGMQEGEGVLREAGPGGQDWTIDTPVPETRRMDDPAADLSSGPETVRGRGLVGRVLCDRYRVTRYLGGGGMGKVYYASDLKLDREVAIKVINVELTRDPEFIERFRRESKILARIQHPHVVQVFDRGEEGGLHFFVMALVSGASGEPQNLGELIKSGVPAPAAFKVIKQALSALSAVHGAGVIHRDLKPGNFLIDAGGNAMLADFGIARASRMEGENTITVTGSSAHTPEYAPPEQMADPTKVDARSDIYAMGVVFYKTLTGNLPSGWGDDFQPASKARPGEVGPAVDEVIATAMRKDPALRYQSAADMLKAVEEAERKSEMTAMHRPDEAPRGLLDREPRVQKSRAAFAFKLMATLLILLGVASAVAIYLYYPRVGPFWQALKRGDVGQVTELLSRRSSLATQEDPDAPGQKPIDFALKGDRLDLVKLLRQHGGRETPDDKGQTLLHRAADTGDGERVDQLIGAGAEIDPVDKAGQTPLFLTIVNRNSKLADRLLRAGANVDAVDANNRTPLLVAVEHLDHPSRDVLLARRPNLDLADHSKNAPLQVALRKNDTETFQKLLARAKPNPVASPWDSPLHIAVGRQSVESVKALLERGADVNAKDPAGKTPLAMAVANRWPAGLGLILERKPKLTETDHEGQTALFAAVGRDDVHVEMARKLMDAGAAVDAVDAKKRTPLHWAAERKAAALAVLMLDKNRALAGMKDAEGKTPADLVPGGNVDPDANATYVAIVHNDLLEAIQRNDGPKVKELAMRARLDNRTDPQTSDRQNLLHYAAVVGFGGDVKALVADLYPEAFAKDGGMSIINEATARRQLTPLHIAAMYNRSDAVKSLLEAGARVDALGEGQQTPLHKAAAAGSIDAVRMLLNEGSPNVTLKDGGGKTAAELAALSPLSGPIGEEIREYYQPEAWARFLKQVSSDLVEPVAVQIRETPQLALRLRDAEGKTALIIASERGNLKIVVPLLDMKQGERLMQIADAQGRRALHAAAAAGKVAVVDELKKRYPKGVDDTDNQGNTPLHLALSWKAEGSDVDVKLEIVDKLLSGENWNSRNSDGKTPWVIAKDSKDAKVLGRFITYRALMGGTKEKPLAGVRREEIESVFTDLGKVDDLDYDDLFSRTKVRGPVPGLSVNVFHRTAGDEGEASVKLTQEICTKLKRRETLAQGLAERLFPLVALPGLGGVGPGPVGVTPNPLALSTADGLTPIEIAAEAKNLKFLSLVFERVAGFVSSDGAPAFALFKPLANARVTIGPAAKAKGTVTLLSMALDAGEEALASTLIDSGASITHANVQAALDRDLAEVVLKVVSLKSADQFEPVGLLTGKYRAATGGVEEPLLHVAIRLKRADLFAAALPKTTDAAVRGEVLRLAALVAEKEGDSVGLLAIVDYIIKDLALARLVDVKGPDGRLPDELITKEGGIKTMIAKARIGFIRQKNLKWAELFKTQKFPHKLENWQIRVAPPNPNAAGPIEKTLVKGVMDSRVADVSSANFEITPATARGFSKSNVVLKEDGAGNVVIVFQLMQPLNLHPLLHPNGNTREIVIVGSLPADDSDPRNAWFGNENVRLINVP